MNMTRVIALALMGLLVTTAGLQAQGRGGGFGRGVVE